MLGGSFSELLGSRLIHAGVAAVDLIEFGFSRDSIRQRQDGTKTVTRLKTRQSCEIGVPARPHKQLTARGLESA